jgi:site-specific recombinase XerD
MCTPSGVQSGPHWYVIYTIIQKLGRNMSDIPPPFSSEPPPKLLDQVRDRIRRLGYAKRTELSYVQWIKRYILFHGKRHPREMGKAEVEAFLTSLAVERHVAAATQNLALSAILFLYREVLAMPLPWLEDVTRAKKPSRLPTVLSREEVISVLGAMALS